MPTPDMNTWMVATDQSVEGLQGSVQNLLSSVASQNTWNAAQTQWNTGIEAQIAGLPAGGTDTGGGTVPVGGGGVNCLFVASSTAPTLVKARADIVCTGVNDQTTINNAIKNANNTFTTKVGQKNPQRGAVLLSEGVFNCSGAVVVPTNGFALMGTSRATVLRPSASATAFTTTGANSPAGEKGLIMAAADIIGQNASMCLIDRISINCEQWGTSAGISGVVIGLTAEPETGSTHPVTYGLPIPTNRNDQNWYISNVHVYGCKYGIYWADSNGARDFFIRDCWVGAVTKAGIYAGASDCQVQGCQVITTTAVGGIGFAVNGGNSKFWNCKASYTDIGVSVGSSRVTIANIEAQDCASGFLLNGSDDLIMTGCRVDTQVAGHKIGFDMTGCTRFSVSACEVHTRGSGTITTGVNLPSGTETGTLQMTVGQTGITTQVAKAGVAVTASSALPKGMITMIAREGAGNLFSAGTTA